MGGLIVRRAPGRHRHLGLLQAGQRVFPCLLGESGITVIKREGDRATPAGRLRILGGYFRRDRMMRLATTMVMHDAATDDGWCDDPAAPQYNRPVRLPFNMSHEFMRREDRLYDICLVLDWNFRPRIRGRGSAIFLHQTSADGKPTLGCIAVEPNLMRKLLKRLRRDAVVRVLP